MKYINKNVIATNTVKYSLQQSTIRNIAKDKKILHVIRELIKKLLTFIKTYFQKILMRPRMKL